MRKENSICLILIMTYDKKIERDKARQRHLQEMKDIQDQMALCYTNSSKWLELNKMLILYEKQLRLYDKIMGYKKEL